MRSELIEVPFLPGGHAFDAELAVTRGLFAAAGRDVNGLAATPVRAVDVAATAAGLLGISAPRGATGRSVATRP